MQYKWTVLTVTTVGVLMSGIDSRIVIVGLPQVAYALQADAEQAIWFTQAYVFASTVGVLLIGRAADIVGRVKIYTLGFAIFTIGSFLTGLSQTPNQVIAFRFVQGIGAACLFTVSATLVTDATPKNELGFAVGINMVAFRIGSMTGLTISGLILSFLDWRFLFFLAVPVGIFGTFWSQRKLKEVAKLDRSAKIDWIGFALVSTSISTLLFALTFAAYGASSSGEVILFLGICVASLALFIFYERRTPNPLLDLSLFKIPEFTGATLASTINAAAWGALLLLISLYFQIGRGFSPLQAGILILPFEFAFLAVGPLSGRLSDRMGKLGFILSGLIIQTAALFLFSTIGFTTPYYYALIYMVIFGAGVGLFASPNMSSIMGSSPPNRRGIASALRATMFNVGYTLSLNLAILFMATTLPYSIVSSLIASNVATISPVDRELFVTSLKNTYLWLGLLNATAIIPSLFGTKYLRARRKVAKKGDEDLRQKGVS